MYVVAEFEENLGIAIVRESWLTPLKKEVFWPPYKQRIQYIKALKSGEDITESWQSYKLKRIFYETDDYEKALQKLKRAEETSDLQSVSETETQNKRKRWCPKQLSSSESDDETYIRSNLSRPPRVKRCDSLLRHVASANVSIISDRTLPTTSSSSIVEAQVENKEDTEINFRTKLFQILFQIKEQNSTIIHLLQKENKENILFGLPEDFPVALPVSSIENLTTLETYFADKSNVAKLVSYLSNIGGKDVTSKTNRIMKHLLVDNIAATYSFYGKRNEKKAFCNLSLKFVVVKAVQKTSPGASDKEIEDIIKVWLKHAPQRLKRSLKLNN